MNDTKTHDSSVTDGGVEPITLEEEVAGSKRRILLPAGLAVGAIVVALALAGQSTERSSVQASGAQGDSPAEAETTTVPPSDERTSVLDGAGVERGFIAETDLEAEPSTALPGNRVGRPVFDSSGELTGYFIAGQLGFVDLATASDGPLLDRLEQCYEIYATTLEASAECTELLGDQGVDTNVAQSVAE